MERITWELSVLSRAVAYKNLSGAAAQVGISQPQLSRIVNKLEQELKVPLLDRTAKRKSSWTSHARELAELYTKYSRKLSSEIQNLSQGSEPTYLRVAALEGLKPLAMKVCNQILKRSSVKILELDVYDLNQLEEFFLKGDLDLIFSKRAPGRTKYRFSRTLGYQTLDPTGKDETVKVMSSFEYGLISKTLKLEEGEKVFISNSLDVRKEWIHQFGGSGPIPSMILKTRPSGNKVPTEEVLMVAVDHLSPKIWERAIGV